MADYIERQAVEKFIEDGLNNPDRSKAFGFDAVEILEEVHYMPAADVAPVVHGRWKQDYFFDEPVTRCSACGVGFAKGHKAERFPYCPNCGAKMDGDGDD